MIVCGNWLTPTKNLTISKYIWKLKFQSHSLKLPVILHYQKGIENLAVSNVWFFKVQLRETSTKVSTPEVGNATHSPQYGSKFYFPLLQDHKASTSCKNTWNTVPYLGLNGLSIILCLWSLLIPLSKLLAIQAHVQNMKEQLWMEGRELVSVIPQRSVTSSDLQQERPVFLSECLNIFATGFCFLENLYKQILTIFVPV